MRLNAPNWQQWGNRDKRPQPQPQSQWSSAGQWATGGKQCPPPQKLATLLLTKKRIHGVVKSYNKGSEFGFITGEEVNEYLGDGCNVFLHKSSLEDSEAASTLVGADVSFWVKLTYEGKPQAREVKVERLKGVSVNTKTQRLCAEGITNQHGPDTLYHGRIKSFEDTSGYGFIVCADLLAIYGRDVFLHHSKRGGFAVGDAVSFLIDVDPVRGSPKARELRAAPESANVPTLEQFAANKVSETGMSTPPDAEIGSSQSTRSPEGSDGVSTDFSPEGQGKQVKHQPDTELILGLPTPSRSEESVLDAELAGSSAESKSSKDGEDPWSRGNDPWSKRDDSRLKERVDPWSCGRDPWSSETSVRTRSKEVRQPSRGRESVGESIHAVNVESGCSSVEIGNGLASPDVMTAVAEDAGSSKAAPTSQDGLTPVLQGGKAESRNEQLSLTSAVAWVRYQSDDGNGAWWWCEADGSWFMEESPHPWCKYMDPISERCYWYKDDEHASFWADSGRIVA